MKKRITALLVAIAVALGISVVAAVPAQANYFTQVCVSPASTYPYGIGVQRMGYSGTVSLGRGQCMSGIKAIWLYGIGHAVITDYGWVGNGQYQTPQNKTYVVTLYP